MLSNVQKAFPACVRSVKRGDVYYADFGSVEDAVGHEMAKKRPVLIIQNNLGNKKLLLLSENVSPIVYMEIMDLFRTFHITPNIESTFDDLTSMFVSIFAGIGVSVIPKSLSQFSTTEGCEVYPIDDVDTSIAYVVAWKKNIANPVARLFIESVKRYCQEEEDDYGL